MGRAAQDRAGENKIRQRIELEGDGRGRIQNKIYKVDTHIAPVYINLLIFLTPLHCMMVLASLLYMNQDRYLTHPMYHGIDLACACVAENKESVILRMGRVRDGGRMGRRVWKEEKRVGG